MFRHSPNQFSTIFGFTRNFEAAPKNRHFGVFNSCTQTEENFGQLVYLKGNYLGFHPNTIRNNSRGLLPLGVANLIWKFEFLPFLAKHDTNFHIEAKMSRKETRKHVYLIDWMSSFRLVPVSCQYHQRLGFYKRSQCSISRSYGGGVIGMSALRMKLPPGAAILPV